jgi:predicted dehydrogenase
VLVLTVEDDVPDPLGMDPFNPASVVASALPGIVPFKPKLEQQEPLKAEIASFLNAVRRHSQPEVTLDAGRDALAIATQIVDAIAAHSERAHLGELSGAK